MAAAAADAGGVAVLFVLLLSGVAKLVGRDRLRISLRASWFGALARPLSYCVPAAEIGVVVCAGALGLRVGCALAIVLLVPMTVFAAREASAGRRCGCFGDLPTGDSVAAVLTRNGLLLGGAVAGAALAGRPDPAALWSGAALAMALIVWSAAGAGLRAGKRAA